jgi:methylenetetrahydrofolate dehydrogenase (NADP+)/methenyltetrahydrofolate cyclohydrolase
MKFINGKKIAAQKMTVLKEVIEQINVEPTLAVVLIGDDPASHLYVRLKEKAAKNIGIELRKYIFDRNISKKDVVDAIEFLNNDKGTNGIIVQLPLPEHLDVEEIVNMVNPQKDVDGFHTINQKKFLANEGCLYPVFPNAIMNLIDDEVKNLQDKDVVILGKSDVFDNVMTHAFEVEGAKVEFIHCKKESKFSDNQKNQINNANIIVTACGIPNVLSCDLISDDTVIIDGGINKIDGKIIGDVDVKSCQDRDVVISSVPGGVGPVTIACLLENVVEVVKKQN